MLHNTLTLPALNPLTSNLTPDMFGKPLSASKSVTTRVTMAHMQPVLCRSCKQRPVLKPQCFAEH